MIFVERLKDGIKTDTDPPLLHLDLTQQTTLPMTMALRTHNQTLPSQKENIGSRSHPV